MSKWIILILGIIHVCWSKAHEYEDHGLNVELGSVLMCDSSIDCPQRSFCDENVGTCVQVQDCEEGSGRVNGNKYGDCVECSTNEQCGWDKKNIFCWPDHTCREKPPFFAYTTAFDDPNTIKNNFTDGEHGCLTVGLNLNDTWGKYFTVNIFTLKECAISNDIDPKWYGKHTLHGPRAPYGIEPFNQDEPKKTGCNTEDPRIHTALIYSKKRDVPMVDMIPGKKRTDKFVVSLLQHRDGNPNPAFDDEPMVVYYDKSDKDVNNNKESHRYGTKIVYEGTRDMATVCWEERAISPEGIPVYIEAVILVKPSEDIPIASDFLSEEEVPKDNVGYTEKQMGIALSRYVNLLSSYGVLSIGGKLKIGDMMMLDKESGNFELLKDHTQISQTTIPVSEFSQTWVDCWTDTKWNGNVWSCESPKLSFNTHVWILITSSIFLIGMVVFVIISMLFYKKKTYVHV